MLQRLIEPKTLMLSENAVEGDVVADRKNHGGCDQAVYAYARENANWGK